MWRRSILRRELGYKMTFEGVVKRNGKTMFCFKEWYLGLQIPEMDGEEMWAEAHKEMADLREGQEIAFIEHARTWGIKLNEFGEPCPYSHAGISPYCDECR